MSKQDEKALEGEIVKPNKKAKKRTPKTRAVTHRASSTIVAGVTTAQLRVALETQTEQRKLIHDFIQKHLVPGVDYGTIAGEGKKSGKKFESGAVLFKPGQEKIFSLFSLTSELEKDVETMEMLDNISNLVAYKCNVFRAGKKITEGRGAAQVGDKGRDVNSTIKIAEKRARMDACLSLGFSEYFTQDLEDPEYKRQAEAAKQRIEAEEAAKAAASTSERYTLSKRLKEAGFNSADQQLKVLEANGITKPKKLTSAQARGMIYKLVNNQYEIPDVVIEEIGSDEEIAADILNADPGEQTDEPEPQEAPPEPELVVDDQFKEAVLERYGQIGFNSSGKIWFLKHAVGKPFSDFPALTDDDWRNVYSLVMDILEGKVEPEPHYFEGGGRDNEQQLPVDFSESKKNQPVMEPPTSGRRKAAAK